MPTARSDTAGSFAFDTPIRPGPFSVTIEPSTLPDNRYIEEIRLSGQAITAESVELRSSAQFEIVLSHQAGTITGTVVDNDGKLFPTSTVTLIPTDPADQISRPMKQTVSADGTFRIANLRPGKYQLLAWEDVDDDLWQDPDFRLKYAARATAITVGAGETRTAQPRAITAETMR